MVKRHCELTSLRAKTAAFGSWFYLQGADAPMEKKPRHLDVPQVAETERELVGRLVARKTEPLVRMLHIGASDRARALIAVCETFPCCRSQDSMLVRIQTAREEMDAVRDFDYGAHVHRDGLCILRLVRCGARFQVFVVMCSGGEPRKPARDDSQQHQCHHHGGKAPRLSAGQLNGT